MHKETSKMYQQSSLAFFEGGSSVPIEMCYINKTLELYNGICSPLLLDDDS